LIERAGRASQLSTGKSPGKHSSNPETRNLNWPYQARRHFLLDFPTGKETDSKAGDNERFERFRASQSEPLIQILPVYSALREGALHYHPRAGPGFAPEERHGLQIASGFHSINRPAEPGIGNSCRADRHDFVGEKLLQAHTWSVSKAFDQTESHPMFSQMVQHLFGVSHGQAERGCGMILVEAKENPGHKIPGQGRASR
jgi:hypothetical protein